MSVHNKVCQLLKLNALKDLQKFIESRDLCLVGKLFQPFQVSVEKLCMFNEKLNAQNTNNDLINNFNSSCKYVCLLKQEKINQMF